MSAQDRYKLVNLGQLGKAGESLFSIAGVPLANELITYGWVPCGMCVNEQNEMLQTFYKPAPSIAGDSAAVGELIAERDALEAIVAALRQQPAPVVDDAMVSALQSTRDRMIAALTPKFGDAFDGDFDVMLEAINALKRIRITLARAQGVRS